MRNFLISFLMLLGMASAFTNTRQSANFAGVVSSSNSIISTMSSSSTQLNMVFGKKKTAAQKAEEEELAAKYWAGEWVCKDCGYVYDRSECAGMFFEEQG